MRVSSRLYICFLVLTEILILIKYEPVEAFVTIPAPVAFAIITAAVKLKLILVKIMFAMRTMGKFHLIQKREAGPEVDLSDLSQNELLAAWTELETEAEREIEFDLESCIVAATEETEEHTRRRKRQMHGWTPKAPIFRTTTTSTTTTTTEATEIEISESSEYAKMISSLIGTMTKSFAACHILQEGLVSKGRLGIGKS